MFARKVKPSIKKKPTTEDIWKTIIGSSPKIVPIVIPNEKESLTTSVPTTEYRLYQIIKQMCENNQDQYGRDRLVSSKSDWKILRDLLPHFDENGTTYEVKETELLYPPIFDSETTCVFEMRDVPGKVVRYNIWYSSVHCQNDPTVKDYWFLKRLEGTGITAPKVYYYSGPLDPNTYDENGVLQVHAGEGKTRKYLDKKSKDRPAVRYAILEKVGMNIDKYIRSQPEKRLSFTEAISIGVEMIDLAQRLHSYDFIHGDAHLGNFAIHNGKVIMLDFGRAKIISQSELMARRMSNPNYYWVSPFISVWEMQKYMLSYRDDVYRILHNIAVCIHGNSFSSYLYYVCDQDNFSREYLSWTTEHVRRQMRQHVIDLKLTGKFFEIPKLDTTHNFPDDITTSFSLEGRVPEGALEDVRRLFDEIMSDLLKVDLFSKPDYEGIKRRLNEMLGVVKECEIASTPSYSVHCQQLTVDLL